MTRAGDSSFIYDSNGNLVEKNSKQGTVKYDYTEGNQLKGVYYSDGNQVEYDYDALGRKVFRASASYDLNYLKSNVNNGNGNGRWNAINNGNGQKVGLYKQLEGVLSSDVTNYMYNGTTTDVMKEYGPEGQPLREYYWANGEVNASKMFGFHGAKETSWEGNVRTRGGLMYYNYDATGNAIGVDDRVGDTVFNYRYDAFGSLFTDMPAPYNTTGYTGKNYDAEAGLMDYSARWYSPTVGRFLTEDTVLGDLGNTQSLNRYSYVQNNPINMVDPSGHVPVPAWVKNRATYYSPEYEKLGTMYYDSWKYVKGWKETTPTTLYDTEQTNKYIKMILQETTTEYWTYDYQRYMEQSEDIWKELEQYADRVTFSESEIKRWDVITTAEDLIHQNASTIASYGPPPNARVSYSSTMNGKPFSYDMIYGDVIKWINQQYNEMIRQIAGHTNPNPFNPNSMVYHETSNSNGNGSFIDGLQIMLGLVGIFPGPGEIADGADALISALRGDKLGTVLGLASMNPFGGQAPGGLKIVRKADSFVEETAEVVIKGTGNSVKQGEFSVTNWDGYPKNGPKPKGPFRLLEGKEYEDARQAANNANAALHRIDPGLKGKQIHEIQPVKFGGSPTDSVNKIPLTPKEHAEYTRYWNNIMRNIKQ
jgi:RHS repeat-associated protein